ncbi:MAG TPA: nitrilase-related carbon-nitrogen hydrolase [Chthoniobacteraceae bacterium]|nr:nitrilase-related carbon-nitrogen hydrolase [Chthoniobacteraceae bacterium]
MPVAVLAIDLEDQESASLERWLRRAAARGALLAVVPFGAAGKKGPEARDFFARQAREAGLIVVAGWEEGNRRKGVVFSARGEILGEAEQTHALPGETFERGNVIRPIATPLGMLGLSLGSDLYFPEVHWSLSQQGAEILIHLEGPSPVYDHFYSVLSPKVRALDVNRPFLIARPSSEVISIVHNEEMEIAGSPLAGSVILDQNGAQLASTGFSSGLAMADLRLQQRCRSLEKGANIPMHRGNDLWRLYFNDSRKRFFGALRQPYQPGPKPEYRKRKIKVAILSHFYGDQIGKDDAVPLALLREACAAQPDIVVLTEMEQGCRPDDPAIASLLEKMVAMTREAGSYLLIGGVRPPSEDDAQYNGRRSSHGWLWNREGEKVFESRIMLYGRGCGQEVFDTDFGRIGIRLCGDVYAPELDRLFALAGADIVFNPSMSWGPSGLLNTEFNQARAMDNGHYIVSAHLAFSDAGQRSHVIDPMGGVVAASPYYTRGVAIAEIDLDSPRGVFVPDGVREVEPGCYLEGYRSTASHRLVPPSELLRLRRPELYEGVDADRPDHPFTTRDRGDGGRI